MDIHLTLKEVFGFDQFRPGQEAIIRKILEGQSALAVFPTGSGKSLCYQLPALHLQGITLVVSPLIALMKDQIDFLHRRGIPAARIDSSLSLDTLREIDSDLAAGKLRLLYVAPERFSNERFLAKLRRLSIALLVIDEAHCISEWGHNFRPDYLKLARIARQLEIPQMLGLTATATPSVAADICKAFAISKDAFVHTGFYRPNLTLRVTPVRAGDQFKVLEERLCERPPGATIVYVTLQATAEYVAASLKKAGFSARAYHAGMESEDRDRVQDWFMADGHPIVVATIAFGMGIDKSDIRYVYHYNLPKSLENYSQEIGRAGRDGKPSTCEILACADDVIVLENFTYGDTPDATAVLSVVDSILAETGAFDIATSEISRKHDIRPLVVSTLLTYLELANVIETTSPFYSEYQFQPLKTSAEILGRFDAERAAFLKSVFARAKKATKWFTLDVAQTAEALQTDRDRIIKALNYLEEHGDIVLKVAGLRQGYRIKAIPANPENLKQRLVKQFETREKNDIQRVADVLTLVDHPGCQVRQLLHHFGEEFPEDCGHCESCISGKRPSLLSKLSAGANARVDFEEDMVLQLRQAHPRALHTARQIARFLCGLTSPQLTQSKLSKHQLFGSMGDVRFHLIMNAASAMLGG